MSKMTDLFIFFTLNQASFHLFKISHFSDVIIFICAFDLNCIVILFGLGFYVCVVWVFFNEYLGCP